jgi:hypothetical protein
VSAAALGVQSETGRLCRVLLKRPAAAFASAERIEREWRSLGYPAPPVLAQAITEHARFGAILEGAGAQIAFLPDVPGTGLDSLYARDSSIACARGLILGNMGKPGAAAGLGRRSDASAPASVCGAITGDGRRGRRA